MKLQRERVGEIADKLKAMPPSSASTQITKQAAITALAEEIRQLQERGYTMADIAKALSDEGLVIAAATLKNYMQRSRTDAARKHGGRHGGRKKVPTTEATPHVMKAHQPATQVKPTNPAPATPSQQPESTKATFAPTEDSKDI